MNEITNIQQPETTETVRLTDKAAGEILRLRSQNNIPEHFGLRIGVKGGGCSGLTYVLGFDEAAKPSDMVLELNGVRVFVDQKSMFFLSGTELDFQDGLNGRGFVFNNPQAAKTCGCGSSFGV